MKQLLACLLLLLLAAPIWAADEEDDFNYETLIIRPKVALEDDESMPGIIKNLMDRIKASNVLGDAADKVIIEPTFASSLEYGTFSLEKYPQLKAYKQDVSDSYNALKALKQTPEFSKSGLNSPAGNLWRKKNETLAVKYKNVVLPYGYENGFNDLNSLAGDFMSIRVGKTNMQQLNSWEETTFIVRHRIENIVQMAIDD